MPDATVLPTSTQLKFFYWANKPKLSVGLTQDSSDNTLNFTVQPTDKDGNLITGGFIAAATNKAGKTERIWVPLGAISASSPLQATGCVRGIDPNGLDYTVGNDDFILELDGGSPLTCVIAAQSGELIRAAIQGLIATGGSGLILGTDALGTVTLYRSTGTGTYVGFLRWETGSTKTEYSNDGSAWSSIDSVTASNLVVVTASDTTPGNLNNKTASGTGITRAVLNPGGNEQLEFSVNGNLADLIADVTATATEINQALDGISANVTDTNLNTLTAGSSSNADALHSHSFPTKSYKAYESIGAADAVALLPVQVKYYSQLTEQNASLGDANARRRYAIKYVAVEDQTIANFNLRLKKVGSATQTITAGWQADSSGEPSGTYLTSDTVAASGLTTSYSTENFVTAQSFVEGTTYWLVVEVDATDGSNYVQVGTNENDDENYHTFTRLTYDLDTATWGNSATDRALFFWADVVLAEALKVCDANSIRTVWRYIGIAAAAGVQGDTINVYEEGVPASVLSGLSEGEYYYVSTTAGELTTTAPSAYLSDGTARLKVGRAVRDADGNVNLDGVRGEKMVYDKIADTVTNTSQLKTWGEVDYVDIQGAFAVSSGEGVSSNGKYDGANNISVRFAHASTGSYLTGNSASISFGRTGTNSFAGVGSDITEAGFTYTTTKTGTGADFNFIWTAYLK